ncbi:phage protease [Methylobacterium aquaticum]|jgi:phage I-like protein|uniref:Mu-like prophage I protein n=1 Tax=Methylobacterium aquaticum TaxID=270351 RepID=A0A0J6SGM3_9HYPH|nr:phage protease [Methylobacterium aquaticum]KMO32488.1 hypothetical protein VP06_17530 [Methylobacterium aquaticum]
MSTRPAISPTTALCAALPLPALAADGAVPDWIHLLPAGEIRTVDGRGPYRVADPAALIALSLNGGARLPLDENHSTDLAAPRGEPAPARGWIVGLQSRDDGLWGQVEWTAHGRRLVGGKAYRHISPVILHAKDGTVTGVLRASLVNAPNLRGLAALHQAGASMDWTTKLRTLLGLPDTADEAAIWAALEAKMGAVATQSAQLAPIAKAVGLAETADGGAVLQAVQALQDPAKVVPAAAVTALQQQLSTLQTDRAKEKAELFVDTAIKAGRIAAPAQMRDHYIARHMADPTAVEKEIGAMPALHGRSGASVLPPPKPGETTPAAGLDPEEMKVISLMGIDPEAYRKTKAAQAEREGVL